VIIGRVAIYPLATKPHSLGPVAPHHFSTTNNTPLPIQCHDHLHTFAKELLKQCEDANVHAPLNIHSDAFGTASLLCFTHVFSLRSMLTSKTFDLFNKSRATHTRHFVVT
jgi:hypothetical protein